jgi:hypothetical protein
MRNLVPCHLWYCRDAPSHEIQRFSYHKLNNKKKEKRWLLRNYLEKNVQKIHNISYASNYSKYICHSPVDNDTFIMLQKMNEKKWFIFSKEKTKWCGKILQLNKRKRIVPRSHILRRKIMDQQKLRVCKLWPKTGSNVVQL